MTDDTAPNDMKRRAEEALKKKLAAAQANTHAGDAKAPGGKSRRQGRQAAQAADHPSPGSLMAVYDKPPKRDNNSSRGKHRRDLIAEYNKRYSEQPGGQTKPPSPRTDDEKA